MLTMPEPRPVALVGDLLATQAQVAGAAAILVDASIRDVEELAEMGLPIWARWVRVKGALKETAGEINVPVTVGGATINPGDVLVLDADGVAVVPQDRVAEVLEASLAREEKERIKREKLQAGAKSYDLDGLRAVVEEQQTMSELKTTGHRSPGTDRAVHPQASGEPRVLHRDDGHGGRSTRRASRSTCAAGTTTRSGR